jgi:hypothetical protein
LTFCASAWARKAISLAVRLGPQGHFPGRGHVFLQLTNHLFKWHFLRGFLSLALSGPGLIALCNLVLRLGLIAACHRRLSPRPAAGTLPFAPA